MDLRAFITTTGFVALCAACALPAPHLVIDPAIDSATAMVIEETWQEFSGFARARSACFRTTCRRDR